MQRDTKKILGWIGVGLVVLGQLLPWGYRARPLGEVWDILFSRVSRPNGEWWIWFLAPVATAALAVRSLMRDATVDKSVLIPVLIFLVAWAGLIMIGTRRYIHFTEVSILATFAGLLLLSVVALMPDR